MNQRPTINSHPGLTVWFTGLSAAGKSTLSRTVAQQLAALNLRTELLDADQVRQNLNRDLKFTKQDRDENVRRIAYVAHLLTRHGVIVLVSAISPYRDARNQARQRIGNFLEIFVDAPLAVCQQRDPIGLYRRQRAGEIQHIAGIDDPYEAPLAPDLHLRTDTTNIETCATTIVNHVLETLRNTK